MNRSAFVLAAVLLLVSLALAAGPKAIYKVMRLSPTAVAISCPDGAQATYSTPRQTVIVIECR